VRHTSNSFLFPYSKATFISPDGEENLLGSIEDNYVGDREVIQIAT
jgi:hypothetical protein